MKWQSGLTVEYQNAKYEAEVDSVVSLDQREIYFTINDAVSDPKLLPETLQLIYNIESKKYKLGHCTGAIGPNTTAQPIIDAVITSLRREEENFHGYSDQLKTF